MRPAGWSRLRISVAVTTAITILTLTSVTSPPSTAHACSCLFDEHWGFLGTARGRLPANAAGVPWYRPAGRWWEEERPGENIEHRFTAEILDGSKYRQLPVSVRRLDVFSDDYSGVYVVAPAGERLQPGATYRFSVDQAGEGHRQVIVTVDRDTLTEGASFDLETGKLMNERLTVPMSASCVGGLDAALVHIKGSLSSDAERWREQLLYRTIVDDRIHWRASESMCSSDVPGRTDSAVGHDRVYAACDTFAISGPDYHGALRPGRHTLKMQAYLPGTDVVLETAVKSVSLRCYGREPNRRIPHLP